MKLKIRTGLEKLDELINSIQPFIVHSYGPPQSGKTTLAIQSVLSAINSGAKCLWIDTDLKFDIRRVKQIGRNMGFKSVKLDYVMAIDGKSVLKAINLAEKYDFVVIDTLTSPFRTPTPKDEFQLKSLLYEKVLPKIGMLSLSGVRFWIINQSFKAYGKIIAVEGKIISKFSKLEIMHEVDEWEVWLHITKGQEPYHIGASLDSGILTELNEPLLKPSEVIS